MSKPSFIVAVGASAGGLEALQQMFKQASNNSGIAYVVIQHLSPDYKSMMQELLSRHTEINVVVAEEGIKVESDTIYLIPPKKYLSILDGKLYLDEQGQDTRITLPIDKFFRSLSKEMGNKGICVILSGTGSDGTLGLKAIKEAGGTILAQNPETAKFDGMPQSAIDTHLVDFVLNTEAIIPKIKHFIEHPFAKDKELRPKGGSEDFSGLAKILHLIRDTEGIDYSHYKENTLIRRLERRISLNQFESINEYANHIEENPNELAALNRDFLIGVTQFFRDYKAYDALKTKAFPILFGSEKEIVRIWTAACSTGEETYSIAIQIEEYLAANNIKANYKLFATDIDKSAIEFAGAGVYNESVLSEVDSELVKKYFNKQNNGYQIKEHIRKKIIFATHNLLKDPPFSKIDLISCRNLFIYLKPEHQSRTLEKMYGCLNANGLLFMGSSETIGKLDNAFAPISSKYKIFEKKPGFQPSFLFEKSMPSAAVNLGLSINKARYNKKNDFVINILNLITPPSIILDQNLNIVQVINDISPYLKLQSGSFSSSIDSYLSGNLSLIVNNLVRRLNQHDGPISFQNVEYNNENEKTTIEGRKITDHTSNLNYYLVSFLKEEKKAQNEANAGDSNAIFNNEEYQERIADLEREVQFTRENLQATVEELETSNEELQSSNEELIASNEELQSTNEELQSVNEELYTVNSEYQDKINELTELNLDMNNLLNNTEVAALYLDNTLKIRKFTPKLSEITNILNQDIGRPIEHFSTKDLYKDFIDDIKKVQNTLQRIEMEFAHKNGELYMLRIVPYRTDYESVEGILVSLVNISAMKQERLVSRISKSRLQEALEMGNMAWWEWNIPSSHVDYHEKKATMLGYTVDEFPDDVNEICSYIHPDDYERTMTAMRDHLKGITPKYEVAYRIKAKNDTYRWYYDKGGVIERDKNGAPLKLIGIVADITAEKLLEQQLLQKGNSLESQLKSILEPALIIDNNGRVKSANDSFLKLCQTPFNKLIEQDTNALEWKFNANGEEIGINELLDNSPFELLIPKVKSKNIGIAYSIIIEKELKILLIVKQ